MLYSFFGTDIYTVRKKAHEHIALFESKGASVNLITPENWSDEAFESALGSSSLFGEAQIFCIDTPSDEADMEAYVFGALALFAESSNIFILIERGLLAPEKKKLEKHASLNEEYTAVKEERFNVFGLAEALLRHDKRSLWILYRQAVTSGLSVEEIIGTLFWQIKTLRLVTVSKSAEQAGLKPFVYSKAKSALLKFKEGELDRLSRELVTLYHDGHTGRRDIEASLEAWILSL